MNKEKQISRVGCKKTCLLLMIASALSTTNVFADAVWVQQIQGGEMRFYDWGYSGPQGQNAGQFDYNGFDTAAQIQHVVTVAPDRLTPDDPALIRTDLSTLPLFREAKRVRGQSNNSSLEQFFWLF